LAETEITLMQQDFFNGLNSLSTKPLMACICPLFLCSVVISWHSYRLAPRLC